MKITVIKLIKFAGAGAVVLWLVFVMAYFTYSGEYYVKRKKIPFEIKEKKSKYFQKGWKIWIKEGKDGYRNLVIKRERLAGNTLKEENIFKSDIIEKPRKAVLITGISSKKHPITVPKETFVHRIHRMESTAYDPSPESNSLDWAGITALGWRTRFGIAAVDPGIIALRRLIYVDGYGFAWTGDTGGDIKGKRIDLCFNTTGEALKWGRKNVNVLVLGTKPLSYYRAKRKRNN